MENPVSFARTLIGNFDAVHLHSMAKRREGEELLRILKDRMFCESNYARWLENIGNNTYFTDIQSSVGSAVRTVLKDALNKASQATQLSQDISTDVVAPLRELLDSQAQALKKAAFEGKSLERERTLKLDRLGKAKNKYWECCSDCEHLLTKIEGSSEDRTRGKLAEKLVENKKFLEKSLESYLSALDSHNSFIKSFKQQMGSILASYQSQEIERVSMIKDSLRKLVVYDISVARNVQYDLDNITERLECIDPVSDLNSFIAGNSQRQCRIEEFLPYEGTHPKFKNIGSALPLIVLTTNSVSSSYRSAIDLFYDQQMHSIVSKIWTNDALSSEDYAKYSAIIRDFIGKKSLLRVLDLRREQGFHQISDQGFSSLSELMYSLLNECNRTTDIQTIQGILHLSSAFFKESTKETLESAIATHSLWRRSDVWEQIIQQSIDDEIIKKEAYKPLNTDELQELHVVVSSIVYNQLVFFIKKLCKLKNSQDSTSEIIAKYAANYVLPEHNKTALDAEIVDRYSHLNSN